MEVLQNAPRASLVLSATLLLWAAWTYSTPVGGDRPMPYTIPGAAMHYLTQPVTVPDGATSRPSSDGQRDGERLRAFAQCVAHAEQPLCAAYPAALSSLPEYDDWLRHYQQIQAYTAPLRSVGQHTYAGYSGPWLENRFITALSAKPPGYWYPLIPLFVQWTDICCGGVQGSEAQQKHYEELESALFDTRLIRHDMLYVALTNHDAGVPAAHRRICTGYNNVIVLSAGGWGNAALPLLKGAQAALLPSDRAVRMLIASFVGSLHQGREHMPELMKASSVPDKYLHVGLGDWRPVASKTVFGLAPRGYGRSSYRLTELMQTGVIPVALHGDDDIPWIPYMTGEWKEQVTRGNGTLWGPVPGKPVGFAMSYSQLPAFLCFACELLQPDSGSSLPSWTFTGRDAEGCPCSAQRWDSLAGSAGGFAVLQSSAIAALERNIAASVPAYFTFDGAIKQIEAWIEQKPVDSSGHATAISCFQKPSAIGTTSWDPQRIPPVPRYPDAAASAAWWARAELLLGMAVLLAALAGYDAVATLRGPTAAAVWTAAVQGVLTGAQWVRGVGSRGYRRLRQQEGDAGTRD